MNLAFSALQCIAVLVKERSLWRKVSIIRTSHAAEKNTQDFFQEIGISEKQGLSLTSV